MAIFTAIAAAVSYIATALGASWALAYTIGAWVGVTAKVVFALSMTNLFIKTLGKKQTPRQASGSRVQLPPATDNKIPVIYGKSFVGSAVVDAFITPDLKTMYYVVAIAEHTDTTAGSGYTFGTIFYDNKTVSFDGVDQSKVVSLTTNADPPQVDTKVNGYLNIYLFRNGSASGSGQNTNLNAWDIMPSWTSNMTMDNCAFAIVKVTYSTDAGTTNLGALQFELTNSLDKPGDVLKDYLLNTRYGCAVPIEQINTTAITALNTYSDETITYIPVGGGSATQPRYRINGPLNTGDDCFSNLQYIMDACDSWLQYNAASGQWTPVINQSFTDYTTTSSLFLVDSSNLVSGIDVTPIDLNETYNVVEVQYPNTNVRDQLDMQKIKLSDIAPQTMSPNEPDNKLTMQMPIVNNAVQAKYIALRRLLQSREDLSINFQTDYSGIQISAGDVIRVTLDVYGWDQKIFRVANVTEEKYNDGNLGCRLAAFEYNDTIYADNSIQDFVPEMNTGLADPNIIDFPGIPTFTTATITTGTIDNFTVNSVVPNFGSVLYMDFNYGSTSTTANHILYRTLQQADGRPFANTSSVSVTVNDLPTGDYYWSTTARNNMAGRTSTSSQVFSWPGQFVIGGVNVAPGSITTSSFPPDLRPIVLVPSIPLTGNEGDVVLVESGDYQLYRYTGSTWTSALATTSLTGQITETQITDNSISSPKIQANAITATNILAGSIVAGKLAIDSVTATNIVSGSITAGKLNVNTLSAITATMGTLTSGNIIISTSTISTATRLEISSVGTYTMWYGSGVKTSDNAKFFMDINGNAVFSGLLGAAGGVIDYDAVAGGSTSTTAGILKGLRVVQCRDGVPVSFVPAYPPGFDSRITVIFLSGGLTYSPTLGSGNQQYQILETENLTVNGFTPYLKLAENNTGTFTATSVSFAGDPPVATKTSATDAYDNTYRAGFSITIQPTSFNGFGEFAYVDVYLEAKRSGEPDYTVLNTYALSFSTTDTIFGILPNAGANCDFRLSYIAYYGDVTAFSGSTLSYDVSDTGTTVISATPTGVPGVVALAFIE